MKIIHTGAPAGGHNGGKLDGWKQVFRACKEEKICWNRLSLRSRMNRRVSASEPGEKDRLPPLWPAKG
ncbi:hypothetical protein [uncultured Rothia sp.]|uniref:hypothetical protein n=1 Tax=uncultured Rothia sp. TaxID=316088 RepID=UPI00321648EA